MSARATLFNPIKALALAGVLLLASCDDFIDPDSKPRARPAGLVTNIPKEPSARSAALMRYYERRQARLLAQDALRVDGGDIETPYTRTDLARNFETIAFESEHGRCGALRPAPGEAQVLRKWTAPVRVKVEFGRSVSDEIRDKDAAVLAKYTSRLSRITGHPVSVAESNANFHVLVAGEDDRDQVIRRIREMSPDICDGTLDQVRNLSRNIFCLVLTFPSERDGRVYDKAIALIRSEHPDLMRRACIHEELAQGLGLSNDSDTARPSIFNDDEEFALLTTHDEELLRLLYHPNLRPGMSLGQARPLIRRILAGNPGQI